MAKVSLLLLGAVIAGAAGAGFAFPAAAQDRQEEVIVTAPPLNAESTRLNGPLEKVSLSTEVPYGDLDLTRRHDARILRARVRDAAYQTCAQLAQAYPVYQMTSAPSCVRAALSSGMPKAEEAIDSARIGERYNAAYYGYER